MPSLTDHFQEAVRFHELGKLDEAETAYREILQRDPRHAEALHHLGLLALQRNQPAEAAHLIALALGLVPDNTIALKNYGTALVKLQRFDEALASYDRALAVRPDFVEVLYNRGNVLLRMRRLPDALASYDRALVLQPGYTEAWGNRGVVLLDLNRVPEALASLDRALALRADYGDALSNRGNALLRMGRLEEALASYDRALVFKPAALDVLANRGMALLELERAAEALENFDAALAVNSGLAQLHYYRANALVKLSRHEEALASYDRTAALQPDFAEVWSNRGSVLLILKRLEEALHSYDRTLAIRPRFPEALCNRGTVLVEMKRLDEALASYEQARAINPDYAEAQWNESRCLLLQGDFRRGWEKCEARWRIKPQRDTVRDFPGAPWLGGDIAGKTLLLHAEQGFGDTLQFCRYAPLAAERGARVVLEVQPELKSLLSTLDGVAHLLARGETLPAFDLHCPLMSLPLAFETTLPTVPARVPYLRAAPEAVGRWRAVLGGRSGPSIGLVWSGDANHQNDRHRSLTPHLLDPILACGARFVSLQKDYRPADREWLTAHPAVGDFSADLKDFADTAALASLMDVVITVDTAMAHLCGALGRPVWIMLSALGLDRRWMLERADNPWYPTARLYRQPAIDAWDDVVGRIARDLAAFVSAHAASPNALIT